MKKNAFTIVELIVSFVLVSVISFALFRTVLSIQRIQERNILENSFQVFLISINNELGKDLANETITFVSSCGVNCYNIGYSNGIKKLSIDRENNIFSYGDVAYELPNKYKFIENLELTKFVTDDDGLNSFFSIKISVKGEYKDKVEEIKYMYSYNSNENPLTYTSIEDYVNYIPRYTVRRSLTSSDTTWERLDDNVGKVANATLNGDNVQNDFDNIYPWSGIITYNYNTATNKITAYYGDSNFKFDGSNGEVLTKIPGFYYKREQKDGYEYVSISPYQLDGYTSSPQFSVGRYASSYDGAKLHSISNTLPEVQRNITDFRTLSKNLGTNFGQMDYHYFLLELLYLVEYADYDSQAKLGIGLTGFRYNADDKALIAEDNTNRIVINTTGGNSFVVGQYIHIGTSVGSTRIAKYRKITQIEDYSANGITGKSITFDGDAVNVSVDNVIYSSGQQNGLCDTLGMKSGTLNNDSKHCMIYRGIENIYGNAWQFVDGINVKDNSAYINYNPSTYAVDTFTGDYKQIGYTAPENAVGWIKSLGYDSSNPLIGLSTSVDESNSTYIPDYHWGDSNDNIGRILLAGGRLDDGNYVGLWYFDDLKPDYLATNVVSRLLKY